MNIFSIRIEHHVPYFEGENFMDVRVECWNPQHQGLKSRAQVHVST